MTLEQTAQYCKYLYIVNIVVVVVVIIACVNNMSSLPI